MAFLAICLVCAAKRKKRPLMVPAAVCVEEHEVVQETVVAGSCGEQTVTIEDDVSIHEVAGGVVVGVGTGSCEQAEGAARSRSY